MAERALVLIDIQNDYFPGGSMALEGPDAAAANALGGLARNMTAGPSPLHNSPTTPVLPIAVVTS